MSLAERLAEDRRAAVLTVLLAVEGHGLNEDLLARELMRLRTGAVTRDDMRGLLGWLERQALVTVERLQDGRGAELWAATATRLGRDVARGAAWAGVAAPL